MRASTDITSFVSVEENEEIYYSTEIRTYGEGDQIIRVMRFSIMNSNGCPMVIHDVHLSKEPIMMTKKDLEDAFYARMSEAIVPAVSVSGATEQDAF